MKTEQVGEFEIKSLTVGEGLHLMSQADSGDKNFQTNLLYACVTKNGESIKDLELSEFVPHMTEILRAALTINGFKREGENEEAPQADAQQVDFVDGQVA
jgi:hypothetical protein